MLTAPASQKLHPYHDSPSLLCIYRAYGAPRLSGIRGPRVTTCVRPGRSGPAGAFGPPEGMRHGGRSMVAAWPHGGTAT